MSATQEREDRFAENPLSAIDSRLAAKHLEIVAENGYGIYSGRLRRISIARKNVREAEKKSLSILNRMRKLSGALDMETAVDGVIKANSQERFANGYPDMVYIELAESFLSNDYDRGQVDILDAFGYESLEDEVREIKSNFNSSKKDDVGSTGERAIEGMSGVFIVVPYIARSHIEHAGSVYFHSGLLLDKNAIKGMLESKPLAELK
jgi:hypothetical protein